MSDGVEGKQPNNLDRIVREVAAEQNVDPELLIRLLRLEEEHSELHGWGARPRLRRAAEQILDAALAAKPDAG